MARPPIPTRRPAPEPSVWDKLISILPTFSAERQAAGTMFELPQVNLGGGQPAPRASNLGGPISPSSSAPSSLPPNGAEGQDWMTSVLNNEPIATDASGLGVPRWPYDPTDQTPADFSGFNPLNTYGSTGNPFEGAIAMARWLYGMGGRRDQAAPTPASTPAPTENLPSGSALPEGQSIGNLMYGTSEEGGDSGTTSQQSAPSPAPVLPSQKASKFDLNDPVTKVFLAQAGINLLQGGHGNILQNVGNAVGRGGEAVKRYTTAEAEQAQQGVENRQKDEAIAVASSRAKRTKETTAEEVTKDMSPEAKVFFRQRVKSIKGEDPLTGEAVDATEQYAKILQETNLVDKKARMGKGQLKSSDISDRDIALVAADPTKEKTLLSWVSASPGETEIIKTRIQNARATPATPLR
jgi:hypothetical protein